MSAQARPRNAAFDGSTASTPAAVALAYFGKLPSRGDFVRSPGQAALAQTLDRWSTQGLEAMAEEPRWKEIYDQASPLQFAFMGVRSRTVLAGHLVASRDAAGRRFPFIVAGSFDLGGPAHHAGVPLAFMGRGPLALARPWHRLQSLTTGVVDAVDATPGLAELGQAQVEVETTPQPYDAAFRDFLELQTVGSVEASLRRAGHATTLRRTLLALGLLLRPVPASGKSALEKGLRLPLPADPLYQPLVATLWLDLVARFLTRGDFEIVLFLPTRPQQPPVLQIGFSGGAPTLLQAALDPAVGRSVFVDLDDAAWVDEPAAPDPGLRRFSSHLEQPALSMHQAVATFGEVFLGE